MSPPNITITVLIDSGAPWCEGDCAIDWSKEQHQALARAKVREKTGGGAEVEFVDATSPALDARQSALVRRVGCEKLPFPVLMLNGNPRIDGPFDIRMLLDIVEVEMERDL